MTTSAVRLCHTEDHTDTFRVGSEGGDGPVNAIFSCLDSAPLAARILTLAERTFKRAYKDMLQPEVPSCDLPGSRDDRRRDRSVGQST